jgi:hypothetical protein
LFSTPDARTPGHRSLFRKKKESVAMQQEVQLKSRLGHLDRLGRVPHLRFGAALALALAAAFVAWLVIGNHGRSVTANSPAASQSNAAVPNTAGTGPVARSAEDLKAFAAAIGHPIYWAGPKAGNTYELTQTSSGRVYVRYLPRSVPVGVNKPYLTIATYPYPHALAALKALTNQSGAIQLDHGGLALVDRAYPKSVHLAYPGSNYEVEVFSPSPARSRQVVVSGQVAALG